MRPHGQAEISAQHPRALGICDRCGFRYNHYELQWQLEWQGPKLQNIRTLVCDSCLDIPQEQLRTIVLPADPVPIDNPRPEFNTSNNNPITTLGGTPIYSRTNGANIGSMSAGGGLNAAFDSNTNKPFSMCANKAISDSSYGNTIGKNWSGDGSGITTPTSLAPPSQEYAAVSFTAYAPNDRPFLNSGATPYLFQGSSDGSTWTTLGSGTTAGTIGEVLTNDTLSGADYGYHRLAFRGDGLTTVGVAQLEIIVASYGGF